MNSNLTRGLQRRIYGLLVEAKSETVALGRAARAERQSADSFFVTPMEQPALSRFPNGVAAALKRHFEQQGLHKLARSVEPCARLGRRRRKKKPIEHEVSDVVYQMH